MLELANEPYPPMADYTLWLSDGRADMTSEELEEQHRRDRETYRLMRERMAADPAYREARLAVSRGTSRRWKERNGNRLDVKLLRLNRDREKWAAKGAELNARKRERYVGERAEKIRQRNREWYARNREARRAYSKRYRQEHIEELRERERDANRRSYAANPRAHLDYYKAWRERNLDRARGYVRVASNKRRAAVGSFTVDEWFALLE